MLPRDRPDLGANEVREPRMRAGPTLLEAAFVRCHQ